jgi:two-component system OmpR family response regulator
MSLNQNILIVDDHEEIRELVQRFLQQHGFNATTAENATEMKKLLQENHFDLIVLDIMLPDEDGLSICKSLRSSNNQIPIIMLTAVADDSDLIIGLELGADDYITKPFNPRELLARIRAVLRRFEEQNNNKTIESQKKYYYFSNCYLDTNKRILHNQQEDSINLSTAEFNLLLTFIQHPQTTLSRDQLLDLARGRESQLFDRSIDTLISRLRRKLKILEPSEELIKTVWGGGYCFICEVTSND